MIPEQWIVIALLFALAGVGMARTCYVEKSFKAASMERIDQANSIIEEYQAQGHSLTLRQLFYQLVARGLLENTQRAYKNLGSLINDARLAGLVDWSHIEDRGRSLYGHRTYDDPGQAIRSLRWGYKEDIQAGQDTRIEVWVEKEALRDVIAGAASPLRADYFAVKGYCSASAMHQAAQRHIRYEDEGQRVVVLYLGDHDPSGLDMDRDIRERLALFGARTTVQRVALTWDQVQEHNPPPNPAKLTDSRAPDYVAQYGHESWELDALQPQVLEDLIRDAAYSYRAQSAWDEAIDAEDTNQSLINQVSRRWDEVADFLQGGE